VPWYGYALLIGVAFFTLAFWLSETVAHRVHRSRPHRDESATGEGSEQQLYDEVAHWDDKQE
jgi:hypothetical protein